MGKRNPAFDPAQLGLALGTPEPVRSDGALALLRRQTSSAVGLMMKGDSRTRFEIAGAVSALMDDDVSKAMLDAYASESRDAHGVPFDRLLAITAVTGRYDILRGLMAKIGCDLLVGEQAWLARVGDLEARKRGIDAELKALKSVIEPRDAGGRHK